MRDIKSTLKFILSYAVHGYAEGQETPFFGDGPFKVALKNEDMNSFLEEEGVRAGFYWEAFIRAKLVGGVWHLQSKGEDYFASLGTSTVILKKVKKSLL